MSYDWVINVLDDLQTFASANGLQGLARQLDDTRRVAEEEIYPIGRSVAERPPEPAQEPGE